MKVISTSTKGNFVIQKNEQNILEFIYKDWFSSIGTTQYNGNEIVIKSKNIWYSKFDIYKNHRDVGDLHFNWKGQIVLRLIDERNLEKNYLLKIKGFWGQIFELSDEQNQTIFALKASINWQKFNYNYEVEILSNQLTDSEIYELLVCCVYGANLYMAMIMSSTM